MTDDHRLYRLFNDTIFQQFIILTQDDWIVNYVEKSRSSLTC